MIITELLAVPGVRRVLGAQYERGVAEAVAGYHDSSADEDSVTGALGQSLRGQGTIDLGDGRVVNWKTRYRKLRGRGKGAPEKKLGADGVFEIELLDENGVRSRKTLPFQAKNNRRSFGEKSLVNQSAKIAKLPGGGIVVNYSPNGYTALDAGEIAARSLETEEVPLERKLVDEFLGCKIGSASYTYDPSKRAFIALMAGVLTEQPTTVAHRVKTTLEVRGF